MVSAGAFEPTQSPRDSWRPNRLDPYVDWWTQPDVRRRIIAEGGAGDRSVTHLSGLSVTYVPDRSLLWPQGTTCRTNGTSRTLPVGEVPNRFWSGSAQSSAIKRASVVANGGIQSSMPRFIWLDSQRVKAIVWGTPGVTRTLP